MFLLFGTYSSQIQIKRIPIGRPLRFVVVALSGISGLLLSPVTFRYRGGHTFAVVALALSCRGSQTFDLAHSCRGGRTFALTLGCTGGRTVALALTFRGQSIGLARGTTGWRLLGAAGLESGVAGFGSGTRSGTRAW